MANFQSKFRTMDVSLIVRSDHVQHPILVGLVRHRHLEVGGAAGGAHQVEVRAGAEGVAPGHDLRRHAEGFRHREVPTPGNINVNLGGFARRFSTVSDRFFGSWCRFPESWRQDGENGEKMGKKRGKMGEKWPKKSGGKLT